MDIKKDISLKDKHTFHIDIKTKYYFEVKNRDDLLNLVKNRKFQNSEKIFIGKGSNLLFKQNYDGFVIKMGNLGIDIDEKGDKILVKAKAGEDWSGFVDMMVDKGYYGVENLAYIPGSVGAAPVQNIGAYGVEAADIIKSVEYFDLSDQKFKTIDKKSCQFGYRESIFKKNKNFIVYSVTFELMKEGKLNLNYGAIKRYLEQFDKPYSLKMVKDVVVDIRKSKLPEDIELGNGGSFFKNPIISNQFFEKLKTEFSDISGYKTEKGIKLSAGWLIDNSGWRGKRIKDAGVYKKHALILVNYGNSTGEEIYNLSLEIVKSVKDKFGIELEREVLVL